MNLPTIPHDKAMHVLYGLVAFLLGNALHSWKAGIILAALLAVAKELYDKWSGKGTPDGWDIVATIAGAVLGKMAQYEGILT